MYSVLLQDWITVRAASSALTVTQSELAWLDVEEYRDIVFWLDVRDVTLGGATSLSVAYQTSPTKDEALFAAMATVSPLTVSGSATVTKVLVSQNPTMPLTKWVRWVLSANSNPSSEWAATFRIYCALSACGGS